MKTRKAAGLAAVALVALAVRVPSANAQTLIEIFESILDQAIHAPLPAVLGPLVTAAENADTIAIASLEIAAGLRERRILIKYSSACREDQRALDRQLKAIAEIKSKLAGIKNRRTAEDRKAEEDGWDPFHARFSAGGPVTLPGVYTFTLLDDGFSDIPGDNPEGPISAVILPQSAGYIDFYVKALDGTMTVEFVPTGNPTIFQIDISAFSYTLDSFEIAPGVPTGVNTGVINPFGSPPVGEYDADSKQFEIRLEGAFTNSLFGSSRPMLFFASIFGGLDEALGEAMVAADDPMIIPLLGPAVELDLPKVMGAHVLEFDAGAGTLTLLENTTLDPGADIAMVRYSDGSYALDPALDEAVGGRVVIDPLAYTGESPTGVFNFADTPIRIEKGAATILNGFLRKPVLDLGTGSLFADLEIKIVSGSSSVLAQMDAIAGTKVMQIAVGGDAYDLVALTNGFTVSGRMLWPQMFHLGLVDPTKGCAGFLCGDSNCDGTFNGADIDAFFLALVDPNAWRNTYTCDFLCANDINQDGQVNGGDIDPFFVALGEGNCP